MPTRAEAFDFVQEFSEVVEASGKVLSWDKDLGRNAVRIGVGTDREVAATVHAANSANPWWGVAENVVDRLVTSYGDAWCVILLEGSSERGYLLRGTDVREGVEQGRWTFQQKSGRQFKFQARRDLRESFPFSSLPELLGIVRALFGWTVQHGEGQGPEGSDRGPRVD